MPAAKKIEEQSWDIPLEDFEWRPLFSFDSAQGRTGQYAAYPDARTVAKHLDRLFTPWGWKDEYTLAGNSVVCHLSIKDKEANEWVTKSDIGVASNQEPQKGAFSDAFKRAAAKWGVGRNAYDITGIYGPVDDKDRMPKKAPDGRPMEEWLVDKAYAALRDNATRPLSSDSVPAPEPVPAPAPAAEVVEDLEVPDEEWQSFMSIVKALPAEGKGLVKSWWEENGSGTSQPQRDIDQETFSELFSQVKRIQEKVAVDLVKSELGGSEDTEPF